MFFKVFMDSSSARLLTTLLVFKNTINSELIRSLHAYRLKNGKELVVEREFFFSETGPYVEMPASPLLRLEKFLVSEVCDGHVNGVWLCIFAFHADQVPDIAIIPSFLLLSRNPKLKTISRLADELHIIFELICQKEDPRTRKSPKVDSGKEKSNNQNQPRRISAALDQDLNCLPYTVSRPEPIKDKQAESYLPGIVEKKKRAASERIAGLALSDLVMYFDLPIAEASRNLKVGLTVLKRKCRELGIPRWPHRKIKSLDNLIRNLQEEAKRQQKENKAAAMAVAKRQRLLESEKERIERTPFMEIQTETKRFRQDVFKRRHRTRSLKKRHSSRTDEESKAIGE